MSVDTLHLPSANPDSITGLVDWERHRFFDGVAYVDPVMGDAGLDLLVRMHRQSIGALRHSSEVEDIAEGTRGAVFAVGSGAVKKYYAQKREEVSGLAAIRANLALATSLEQQDARLGSFALRGCRPRAYFEPSHIAAHPTWLMDRVDGESLEDMICPPYEATDSMASTRKALCEDALMSSGFDPREVYLDEVASNLMVVADKSEIVVIDAMKPW